MYLKTIINTAVTVLFGLAVILLSTNNLNAFTSEGVRRLSVLNNPVDLPVVELTDARGNLFYLHDYIGEVVLVDFVFTNCQGACPLMTKTFMQLQAEFKHKSIEKHVVLLTISFDNKRDTKKQLHAFAQSVGADNERWVFANIDKAADLEQMLSVFGIVVIASENGQFEHNAAIHKVDKQGRLAKIYDYESSDIIMRDIMADIQGKLL